ncbi:hypothetical protein C7B77_13175 [Chamaesiphon polymorphus CCALA 037]|uniref:PQ-loop repeat-containing protein n=2 Tax=Chamaesiphon TaxID=217161 RepID=A0A2T1GEP9_9CYAN|nr:hypothetical protein C7B77_13175 [Chamaesiphon polymorphus CCALA 037]
MAAGLILLLGNIPYILSIRRGDTRPNRVTWGIWTTIGFILVGSYYAIGATNTLWLPIAQVISQLIITCYAFKYSKGRWQRLDRICLAGAGLSLLLWWRSGSPLVALAMNIAMDILGAIPTIKKIYYEPDSEDLLFWVMAFSASVLNLLAIESFTLSFLLFPLYLFMLNITVLILLTRPRWSQLWG